jgi:hypothetical protein
MLTALWLSEDYVATMVTDELERWGLFPLLVLRRGGSICHKQDLANLVVPNTLWLRLNTYKIKHVPSACGKSI